MVQFFNGREKEDTNKETNNCSYKGRSKDFGSVWCFEKMSRFF